MKCPHCEYTPEINEFDYASAPGRFFVLPIKMEQESNAHAKYGDQCEKVYGCPSCGILFMNM